jgi:hypothetical protein
MRPIVVQMNEGFVIPIAKNKAIYCIQADQINTEIKSRPVANLLVIAMTSLLNEGA